MIILRQSRLKSGERRPWRRRQSRRKQPGLVTARPKPSTKRTKPARKPFTKPTAIDLGRKGFEELKGCAVAQPVAHCRTKPLFFPCPPSTCRARQVRPSAL